jgi:6,7-dimethyl-8-ribityllumazine synthase
MKVEVFSAEPNGRGLRVGVVQARYNAPVCETLTQACLAELERLGVQSEDVFVCTVPGALEVPQALQMMAQTTEFDALVALGAVIRGETYHFEVVSNESAKALMQVALEFSTPIANGILTTETDEQALVRAREKGTDAARAAVEMANLDAAISSLSGVDGLDDEDEDEV